MTWQREPFRAHYRSTIGTDAASNSYVSYLNLVDDLFGGLDERLASVTADQAIRLLEAQPRDGFTNARSLNNCRSALRAYLAFECQVTPPSTDDEVRSLLRVAKALGARYYKATGKPLGVTGEVAELEAAEYLGLRLAVARCPGYDAIAPDERRVQVKGRAVDPAKRYIGRCPAIKGDGFDTVALVLLDQSTLNAIEIWEADAAAIIARLDAPGSMARNIRRSLAISQFTSIARRTWERTVA